MDKIFKKIDTLICNYLGLEIESTSPHTVEIKKNGQLTIASTASFKRHSYKKSWNEFKKLELNKIDQSNRAKLGIAMGKAIAKNLVISFDDIDIHKEQVDA